MGIFVLTILSLTSILVNAQTIGAVSHGGTGCPKGTLSSTMAHDEQELVLNYNKFFVRSGPGTGKIFDRKACSLNIPVSVPKDYQMALVAESDGKALVRKNGQATLTVESFYPGSKGVKNSKNYKIGQHLVSIGDSTKSITWSPCGASKKLRMNVSAVTQKDAALYLDQLRFKVFFRSCQ